MSFTIGNRKLAQEDVISLTEANQPYLIKLSGLPTLTTITTLEGDSVEVERQRFECLLLVINREEDKVEYAVARKFTRAETRIVDAHREIIPAFPGIYDVYLYCFPHNNYSFDEFRETLRRLQQHPANFRQTFDTKLFGTLCNHYQITVKPSGLTPSKGGPSGLTPSKGEPSGLTPSLPAKEDSIYTILDSGEINGSDLLQLAKERLTTDTSYLVSTSVKQMANDLKMCERSVEVIPISFFVKFPVFWQKCVTRGDAFLVATKFFRNRFLSFNLKDPEMCKNLIANTYHLDPATVVRGNEAVLDQILALMTTEQKEYLRKITKIHEDREYLLARLG